MLRGLTLSVLLLLASPAWAGGAFSLDPVLLAGVRAADKRSAERAQDLEEVLAERLTSSTLLVRIDDVADYEDYTARVYMESCPLTELDGCAYVMGDRAEALWAIIGTVRQGDDSDEVAVTFVDVPSSRALITFESGVGIGDEAAWAGTVASILDLILEGAAIEEDVRPDTEEWAEQWERRRREAEAAAQQLGEAGGLETLVRIPMDRRLKEPKLEKEELRTYEESDVKTPWERVGMSQAEYLRYRNSGASLDDWRLRMQGRLGSIFLRAGVGFGSGPYRQRYDGRWARDSETLAIVQVDSLQEIENGGTTHFEVEGGFGVLPVLDVAGVVMLRASKLSYYQHQETVGEPEPEGDPTVVGLSTLAFGARATFVPFPTMKARPSLMGGVQLWTGVPVTNKVALPEALTESTYPAPTLLLVDVAPGVEIEVHPMVQIYGRILASIPVAGQRTWQDSIGSGLETTATLYGKSGIGLEPTAGVQIKLGPLFRTGSKTSSDDTFDEPDEDLPPAGGRSRDRDFDDIEDLD